ncbi:hypothetical protein PMF13cell1_02600 [Blautia producta]|uniref:Uncharacterized protein n=1 Tax=Blautia producta TaxID=33035 RepID=A0A4P6LWY6_9FIRM|nr:hypothetical protein [Blautia producta]QBE97051.1 hypothetical protein PMF13cell1_02600 [Blautia producta]
MKTQMVIEFIGTFPAKSRVRKRLVRQYARKYNGNLLVKKDMDRIRIVLTLECV